MTTGTRHSDGYIFLTAPDHPRAQRGYVAEHVLVAERVLGRFLLETEVVHHRDFTRDNNDPSNLQVLTRAEHVEVHAREKRLRAGLPVVVPAVQGGRGQVGTRHHHAKLTPDDVREMRRLHATGDFTQNDLGARFGITRSQVSEAVRGISYRDVAS